jgi:hypothetical protein
MANNFVTISNTGSIGGGLKVLHKAFSWEMYYADATVFVGLAGDTTRSAGTDQDKAFFKFTLMAQLTTPASGYAAMEGAGQCVKIWAKPDTAAHALLIITDPEGTTYNVVWQSAYIKRPMTNYTHGATEWCSMDVLLRER